MSRKKKCKYAEKRIPSSFSHYNGIFVTALRFAKITNIVYGNNKRNQYEKHSSQSDMPNILLCYSDQKCFSEVWL